MINLFWNFMVNIVAASILIPRNIRFRIYNYFGVNTNTSNIFPRCYFRNKGIEIGSGTFINNGCFIENNAMVKIGDRCSIGMEVLIGTDTHEKGTINMRAGKVISKPIVIENGCWIGARSIILPGVRIGEACIIAAGAVVTKDCMPNGLYAGIPARRIKELDCN